MSSSASFRGQYREVRAKTQAVYMIRLTKAHIPFIFNHMVEYRLDLDIVFQALSDQTRRDILRRVSIATLSISDLAQSYKNKMSFTAVAKHVAKLEAAKLVSKTRDGKQQFVTARPATIAAAETYLEEYKRFMNARFDALDKVLKI